MKGIILAGGTGTRLHPLTIAVSKQLLPVYDKPMIYYPLTSLVKAGIKEILIITTPNDRDSFEKLLGDGNKWNLEISYAVQRQPKGVAEALIIGEDFLAGSPVTLVLGDNLFTSEVISREKFEAGVSGAHIFAVRVANASEYGVVEFDVDGLPKSIEEKPTSPKGEHAIPGIYVFDSNAPSYAKLLHPSARGELEITDLIKIYMAADALTVSQLPESMGWFDMGTFDSLYEAGQLVRTIQKRTGESIGDPGIFAPKDH